MTYKERPDIPIPLIQALIESNESYHEELSNWHKAVKWDGPSLSATAMASPPRQKILFKRYNRFIVKDPLDLVSSLIGNVVHYVLETKAAKDPRYSVEEREKMFFDVDGTKVLIHGQYDLYDKQEERLEDWKVTTELNMKLSADSHINQLNVMAYIMRARGVRIKSMRNIYILKSKERGVEQIANIIPVNRPFLPEAQVINYIRERARLHLSVANLSDFKLPECTKEERWMRDNMWKVYFRKKQSKKGQIPDFSTRKAFAAESKEDVLQWVRDTDPAQYNDMKLVESTGIPRKCIKFCEVSQFCHIHQQWLKENPHFVDDSEE